MSILGSNMLAGAAGRARHEIERSLRFNANDSAHLTRTPSSAGNSTTFTWSAWVKTNRTDSHETLFSATPAGNGTQQYDFIFENDQLLVYGIDTFFVYEKKLSRKLRDRSAWYHLVVAFDTTDSTAEDRIKIYVNGERQTDFASNTNPSLNRTTGFNKTNEHSIGARTGYSGAQYFDGYQTEINFIDGLQLGPEYFGETDLETGAWIPKKYRGSFGTNGFYLKFADSSGVTATTLGKDSSGNGNNWTPSGFQVSTPGGMDSMEDTPTNNWCTLNGAANSTGTRTLSDGNLQADLSGGGAKAVGTFLIPTSGKWYWEMMANDSNSNQAPGVLQHDSNFETYDTSKAASYFPNGEYKIESASQVSGFSTYAAQDIISFAFDADVSPPKIYFAKNGTWQNSANPAAGANGLALSADKRYLPYMQHGSSSSSSSGLFNFGQRQFSYTPPTGFKTLNAKNLPTPIVLDGTKYFNTVLYSGDNSSSRTISGVGFQPDFVWIKNRTDSGPYHILTDVVRGGGKTVFSNDTSAEVTNPGAGYVSGFAADGFELSSSGTYKTNVNASSKNYVAWNWKAGGAASVNQDGSLISDVSANPEAGLSIVTYTGTGSETTVGHGLGVTPGMIWVKNRDAGEHWIIDSRLVTGNANGTLHFNSDDEYTGGTNQFGTHSSSIFTVKTSGNINTSGQNYVAYVFSEVEGYSKFGTWTGNGSTDGPFVSCGFKPAFVIWKNSSASYGYNWYIADNARSSSNPVAATLSPILTSSEDTAWGSGIMDFTSNGFKIRRSQDETNRSGDLHIFMAFAEVPFKYANAC